MQMHPPHTHFHLISNFLKGRGRRSSESRAHRCHQIKIIK